MNFRYKKYRLNKNSPILGETLLKPIIPIEIKNKNKSLRYEVLIDSGADFCILDMEIAKALTVSIDPDRWEPFGGINPSDPKNPPKAFFAPVKLNIGGWDIDTEIGFSEDIAKTGFGILGHKGFFEYYKVSFDLLKEEIELVARLK